MQFLPSILAAVVTLVIFGIWLVTRRRIAAGTVGRAKNEADRIVQEAVRNAETTQKEATLNAREVRVMVESDNIDDEEAVWLSKDIAKRIENELEYSGQIKVTVIRETRAVGYAR